MVTPSYPATIPISASTFSLAFKSHPAFRLARRSHTRCRGRGRARSSPRGPGIGSSVGVSCKPVLCWSYPDDRASSGRTMRYGGSDAVDGNGATTADVLEALVVNLRSGIDPRLRETVGVGDGDLDLTNPGSAASPAVNGFPAAMFQGLLTAPAAAVPRPIPIPADATTAAPRCVPSARVLNADETLEGDAVPRRRRW